MWDSFNNFQIGPATSVLSTNHFHFMERPFKVQAHRGALEGGKLGQFQGPQKNVKKKKTLIKKY